MLPLVFGKIPAPLVGVRDGVLAPAQTALGVQLAEKRRPSAVADLRQRRVQRAQIFVQDGVPLVENRIQRRILRDAPKRDMRNGLVLETAADCPVAAFGFVIIELGGKQPLARERDSHAARVYRNPTPPPLLGDVCGRAAAASWVEN